MNPETVLVPLHGVPVPVRIPYSCRRVDVTDIASIDHTNPDRTPGTLVLASVEHIGRTRRLELANGRRSTINAGDLVLCVYGNRYATDQYEGYADYEPGNVCDLLSMGGVVGLVKSQSTAVSQPTRMKLIGHPMNSAGEIMRLSDYRLKSPPVPSAAPPVIAVTGAAMNSGKTTSSSALIRGLTLSGLRVGAVKLTGVGSGSDMWSYLDAGAVAAYDFVDCGYPSTFLVEKEELDEIAPTLFAAVSRNNVDVIVAEIADGVLQKETRIFLSNPEFRRRISGWLYAAPDPLSAIGGVQFLNDRGIAPLAVVGSVTASPLAIREIQSTIAVACLTREQLVNGELELEIATPVQETGQRGRPVPVGV